MMKSFYSLCSYQRSTDDSQRSTVNSQQSTVNGQQTTVGFFTPLLVRTHEPCVPTISPTDNTDYPPDFYIELTFIKFVKFV